MITVLVRFTLPVPLSAEDAASRFERAAGDFRNVPGLVRKYFLHGEDGRTVGGVYLWESRTLAKQFHDSYSRVIRERFGAEPEVVFFSTPYIVENSR